ncbi:hypothetical protein [Klebsiella grimontii]|uniref:hypothetical protein n=1 Tax=Klebsiella grimontii TaxID=2058152 RepID=UPI0012B6B014|nr:hypothetical protein [Klebsiella grimontii]
MKTINNKSMSLSDFTSTCEQVAEIMKCDVNTVMREAAKRLLDEEQTLVKGLNYSELENLSQEEKTNAFIEKMKKHKNRNK